MNIVEHLAVKEADLFSVIGGDQNRPISRVNIWVTNDAPYLLDV